MTNPGEKELVPFSELPCFVHFLPVGYLRQGLLAPISYGCVEKKGVCDTDTEVVFSTKRVGPIGSSQINHRSIGRGLMDHVEVALYLVSPKDGSHRRSDPPVGDDLLSPSLLSSFESSRAHHS